MPAAAKWLLPQFGGGWEGVNLNQHNFAYAELDHLLEQYDLAVLRRAHALALLSQRGHQLPDQNQLPINTEDTFEYPAA